MDLTSTPAKASATAEPAKKQPKKRKRNLEAERLRKRRGRIQRHARLGEDALSKKPIQGKLIKMVRSRLNRTLSAHDSSILAESELKKENEKFVNKKYR